MEDTNMNDLFVLDKNSHIPIFSDTCTFCRHLDASGERRCAAFPQEIPISIWLGENDHHLPYPGDHGIQFELDNPMAFASKTTKVRKRKIAASMRSALISRLRSRIWQDQQVRQQIVEIINPKIVENQSDLAALKQLPSVESIWLNLEGSVKGKPRKRKASSKSS